jgi:short-subunit dehydrogenase
VAAVYDRRKLNKIDMSKFSFRDKAALITGGSRGLGFLIAKELCRSGANVAVLARSVEELTRAKTELEKLGGKVLAIQCDLLLPAHIEFAVQQTLDRFGKIDILINNAGIIEVGPLHHMKREDFERSMRLHFWAPYELTMQIIPHMRRNGGGRIVNISSIGGKVAVPHMAAYSASKFALTGFSDALRAELAHDDIHITTVTPGLMRTGSEIHAKFKGDHAAEYKWFDLSMKIPLASISAERAARKVVAACRRGSPALIMPFTTYLVIAANNLFPNLSGHIAKLVNRFLPSRSDESGDEARSGSEVKR